MLVFRVGGAYTGEVLPNIMPFAAIFFCAAVFARACPMLLPAAAIAWVLGGPITSMMQGYGVFGLVDVVNLGAMFLCVLIGLRLQGQNKMLSLLGGTLLAAVVFYLITNTFSFFVDPRYLKTWEGYTQAMWTGIPGSPYLPTWVFFRNSLCANTVFTILFVVTLKFPAFKVAYRFGLEPVHASH